MDAEFAIAVVIPALNARLTIGEQLDAVLSQQCPVPFQVVVADNGSVDGTVEFVQQRSRSDSRLRLVDASSAPLGGSAAKNLGVLEARAPLIAFCDADDIVAPGWLDALYEGLSSCRVVDATREYWKLNPGLPRDIYPEKLLGTQFYGQPTVSGGAFAAFREDYLATGGFAEDFMGAVDTEFGLRLCSMLGIEPLAAAAAVVHCRVPTRPLARFRRYRSLGRSLPLIQARHRHHLALSSTAERRRRAKSALWLLYRAPYLLDGGRRLRWTQSLGTLVGELEGLAMAKVGRRG